jgi:hypothetical protein
VAALITAYRWWPLDGVSGAYYFRTHPDQTVWASGYTDVGFRAVRAGMTRKEVYALIGQPLETRDDVCGKVYTTQSWIRNPDDAAYWRYRMVTFVGDTAIGTYSFFQVRPRDE